MNKISKKNNIIIFSLIAFFLLLTRNILPFLYYPDEGTSLRLIFESYSGANYLPIIKSFGDFNFSPLYGLDRELSHNNIAFPYLALFIHSISLKLFGPLSFIFIEFVATTIFLILIYRISILLNFNILFSTLISCFFFILPAIIKEINFYINIEIINIVYDNIQKFYGLRIPRPLITNLYFFIFVFILLQIQVDKNYSIKRSIILGFTIGLSIHSFFFLALIEFFTFLLMIIINYRNLFFKHILEKKIFYLNIFFITLFFVILFFFHLINVSNDNLSVIGSHNINVDQKIKLLEFFIKYILNKYFLILFLAHLFLYFYIIKKEKNIILIYLLYISTIFSFLFFIIISNQTSHYYIFQNWIFINGIFFFIFAILKIFYINILKLNLFNFKIFFILLLIFIFSNNLFYYQHYEKDNTIRIDTNKLIKEINKKKLLIDKDDEILLFESDIFTYLALTDFKKFTIIPNVFWTARNFYNIENDILNSFNLLKINISEFDNIFENKILNKRIINNEAVIFFGQKYLANTVFTYENLQNYSEAEKASIASTSPFKTQIIMPKNELERIKSKFINKSYLKSNPKIIILNKNHKITKINKIDLNKYCQNYSNDTYIVYKNILYCK